MVGRGERGVFLLAALTAVAGAFAGGANAALVHRDLLLTLGGVEGRAGGLVYDDAVTVPFPAAGRSFFELTRLNVVSPASQIRYTSDDRGPGELLLLWDPLGDFIFEASPGFDTVGFAQFEVFQLGDVVKLNILSVGGDISGFKPGGSWTELAGASFGGSYRTIVPLPLPAALLAGSVSLALLRRWRWAAAAQ